MKLFLVLLFLASVYLVTMFSMTDAVMGQAKQINNTYQNVANNSEQVISGQATAWPSN